MNGRFVILSDLHLGLSGAQPDGHVYGDVARAIERAVPIVKSHLPAQVFLLGDAVNRGYDHEYQQLHSLLDGVEPIAVIGNHELQRASIIDFQRNMRTRAFRTERIAGVPSLILSSGIEDLPDSQWHGRISSEQLDFIERELRRMELGAVFIFVHHPIAGTTRVSEEPMFGLVNGDELQSLLDERGGSVVVFSAHTHTASVVRRGRFTYIGCPPLGFWPHAFLIVEVDASRLRFRTVRVIEDAAESPDARAADPEYRAARAGTTFDQSGEITLESEPSMR